MAHDFWLWEKLYLAVATAILVVAVLAIWPSDVTQAKESDLLVIVLLGGALGSCIHAMTSYVSYVGNETLRGSWFAWYVLRPFIGAPLALVFFFVLRRQYSLQTRLAATSSPGPTPSATS